MSKETELVSVELEESQWEFVKPEIWPDTPFVASNRQFEINGQTFTYVKGTKPVVLEFVAFHKQCEDALNGAARTVERTGVEHPRYGKLPCYDRWDYYLDLLSFIALEPTNMLDKADLDMDECEQVISVFMPESMRLAATLIGFLNYSQE